MKNVSFLAFSLVVGSFAAASFSSAAGCSTPGATFDAGADDDGTSSGGSNGGSSGPGIGGDGSPQSSGGSGNLPPDLEECGVEQLQGEVKPVELIVMFDKSSSMCVRRSNGQIDCNAADTIWPAATSAIRSFITSQASAGMSLSVNAFGPIAPNPPQVLTPASNRCEATDYAAPTFPPQDLPSPQLADAVVADAPPHSSPTDYNKTMTQTGAVITGTTTYATARRTELAGAKEVALLLISDGKPQGCHDGYNATAEDQAMAVRAATDAAAAGFKLYVLDIDVTGAAIDDLNAVAAAGGTTQAIRVQDATSAEQIGAALAEIRGTVLPCDLAIPTPPNGLQPDFTKLNVTLTPPGQPAETLAQTTDCAANPRGWQYDDPTNPTRILLCEGACNAAQATVNGHINVVLGCATKTTGPN